MRIETHYIVLMKMKYSILAATFLSGMLVFGQQIPSGKYMTTPSGPADSTEIDKIEVKWNEETILSIKFSGNTVQELIFKSGEDRYTCQNVSTSSRNDHPAISGTKNFSNLGHWLTLAKKTKKMYKRINSDMYVNLTPLELAPVSETGSKTVNFTGGGYELNVPSEAWVGSLPTRAAHFNDLRTRFQHLEKKGSYVGFTTGGKYFFTVTRLGENFYVDSSVTEAIKKKSGK